MLGVYNNITEAGTVSEARTALNAQHFDVVVLDRSLPDGDGISLISEIRDSNRGHVIIMLTSNSDLASIKQCMVKGADDYVIKSESIIPDLLVRIPVAVAKASSARRLLSLEQIMKNSFRYEIVGKSPETMALRETVRSLKGMTSTVLITGESGTGKELIARRLHAIEDDGKRPFVAINCGAIPENLIESELFGHKKGSFTNAVVDRQGQFEIAHEGDLFLDEVGELPLSAQVRLLRVLQEGEVVRVGESRPIKVNCRVIAATNQNLEELVRKGKFREDLYHRLNVVRIQTTPLRDRISDVPDLAKMFVLQLGGVIFKIHSSALMALDSYDWPGNIRELRNVIERAVISARRRGSSDIEFQDINFGTPINDMKYRLRRMDASLPMELNDLSPRAYADFLDMTHREYLRSALEAMGGRTDELSEKLGVSRATLFRRMNDLGLSVKNGRVLDSKRKIRKEVNSDGLIVGRLM